MPLPRPTGGSAHDLTDLRRVSLLSATDRGGAGSGFSFHGSRPSPLSASRRYSCFPVGPQASGVLIHGPARPIFQDGSSPWPILAAGPPATVVGIGSGHPHHHTYDPMGYIVTPSTHRPLAPWRGGHRARSVAQHPTTTRIARPSRFPRRSPTASEHPSTPSTTARESSRHRAPGRVPGPLGPSRAPQAPDRPLWDTDRATRAYGALFAPGHGPIRSPRPLDPSSRAPGLCARIGPSAPRYGRITRV